MKIFNYLCSEITVSSTAKVITTPYRAFTTALSRASWFNWTLIPPTWRDSYWIPISVFWINLLYMLHYICMKYFVLKHFFIWSIKVFNSSNITYCNHFELKLNSFYSFFDMTCKPFDNKITSYFSMIQKENKQE